MTEYLVRATILSDGDTIEDSSLLQHIGSRAREFVFWEYDWFVLIISLRKLDSNTLFLQGMLYDLKVNDIWTTARTFDPRYYPYHEMRPYEAHTLLGSKPDRLVINLTVQTYQDYLRTNQ